MNDSQFHELAGLIRGLNGYLIETAQEVADLRVDLQDIAAKLAAILAVVGGAQ